MTYSPDEHDELAKFLAFTMVLFLAVSVTPLRASIGVESQCPPKSLQRTSIELASTDLQQAIPTYNIEERDYMIRTIAFEAPDETDEGKAAVAYVILNRIKSGAWGESIKDVVTHPGQFEPWMTRRKAIKKLSLDDRRYRNAAPIVDAVLTGQRSDPTAGATYFLNPAVVRQRRGGSLPSWAQGEGRTIGNHIFYWSDEGVMLERATLAASPSATSPSCTHLEAGGAPPVG